MLRVWKSAEDDFVSNHATGWDTRETQSGTKTRKEWVLVKIENKTFWKLLYYEIKFY